MSQQSPLSSQLSSPVPDRLCRLSIFGINYFPQKTQDFVLRSARTGDKRHSRRPEHVVTLVDVSESRCQKRYLTTPFQSILPTVIAGILIHDIFKKRFEEKVMMMYGWECERYVDRVKVVNSRSILVAYHDTDLHSSFHHHRVMPSPPPIT